MGTMWHSNSWGPLVDEEGFHVGTERLEERICPSQPRPRPEGRKGFGGARGTRIAGDRAIERRVEEEEYQTHRNLEGVPLLVGEDEVGCRDISLRHRPVTLLPRPLVHKEEVTSAAGAEEAARVWVDHVLVGLGHLLGEKSGPIIRDRSRSRD